MVSLRIFLTETLPSSTICEANFTNSSLLSVDKGGKDITIELPLFEGFYPKSDSTIALSISSINVLSNGWILIVTPSNKEMFAI